MKYFLTITLTFLLLQVSAQNDTEVKAIHHILAKQEAAWNKGDLVEFMQGYWQNDSLVFIGSNGPQYGWQQTLVRYQQTYNSREKMGTLKFELIQTVQISKDTYRVLGKFHLARTIGDAEGFFTLILKKFKEGWRVVYDHTS